MSERPYTVQEVADRWSVSREHVYDLIRQGRLHAFRLGGKLYRVAAAEVERWASGLHLARRRTTLPNPPRPRSLDAAAKVVELYKAKKTK